MRFNRQGAGDANVDDPFVRVAWHSVTERWIARSSCRLRDTARRAASSLLERFAKLEIHVELIAVRHIEAKIGPAFGSHGEAHARAAGRAHAS